MFEPFGLRWLSELVLCRSILSLPECYNSRRGFGQQISTGDVNRSVEQHLRHRCCLHQQPANEAVSVDLRCSPNSKDQQDEDESQLLDRAAKLLNLLRVTDSKAGSDLMRFWRDNMRKYDMNSLLTRFASFHGLLALVGGSLLSSCSHLHSSWRKTMS